MASGLTDGQNQHRGLAKGHACDGVQVLLTIGSNAEDAERRVAQACDYLRTIISGIRLSEAVIAPSYTGIGADYLNIAVTGTCADSCMDLHECLRRYEDTHGRLRPSPDGRVAIDIDVIAYGKDVVKPDDMARPWVTMAFAQLEAGGNFC